MNTFESLPATAASRSLVFFRPTPRFALVLMLSAIAFLGSVLPAAAAPGEADPGTSTGQEQEQSTGTGMGETGPSEWETSSDEPVDNLPASGQFIVDYALQYVGYPYVAAGNGPGGFDCSGFTQFVMINMLGIDIGHGVAGQTNYGTWVEWGAWQPGDLVFFAGTYRSGISHVGIYIGDGQFVHAENYGTGVTISSVWSDYYSGHYYGATRLV